LDRAGQGGHARESWRAGQEPSRRGIMVSATGERRSRPAGPCDPAFAFSRRLTNRCSCQAWRGVVGLCA
jgi:hypothetical protein